MSEKHPYVASSSGLLQLVNQLRKNFPATVNAETIQKFGILPKNESYGINTLKFLGLIDEDGKKTADATKIFSHHSDESFQKDFGALVKKSYSGLFDLHGDDAWKLSRDGLIQFFRTNDSSSDIIGQRQANVFNILAAFSGHAEIPEAKSSSSKPRKTNEGGGSGVKKAVVKKTEKTAQVMDIGGANANFGLTVRVEINLPASGDKATYDNIFKSIKENLING